MFLKKVKVRVRLSDAPPFGRGVSIKGYQTLPFEFNSGGVSIMGYQTLPLEN